MMLNIERLDPAIQFHCHVIDEVVVGELIAPIFRDTFDAVTGTGNLTENGRSGVGFIVRCGLIQYLITGFLFAARQASIFFFRRATTSGLAWDNSLVSCGSLATSYRRTGFLSQT